MAQFNSIIDIPITPEDVLFLRELERARHKHQQLRVESEPLEENASIRAEEH